MQDDGYWRKQPWRIGSTSIVQLWLHGRQMPQEFKQEVEKKLTGEKRNRGK